MTEKGWIPGADLTVTHYDNNLLMGQLRGSFYYGTTTYDGSYNDGTPLVCDTDNFYTNLKAVIGQGYLVNNIALTPYVGMRLRSV